MIRTRLSGPKRLALVLAAMAAIAGASVAGYWSSRSLIQERLDSNAVEIESLRAKLEESRSLRQDLAEEYRSRRDQMEAELKDTHHRLVSTREQLEESKSSLAKVTRQLQIDQSAYKELRKQLEESNKQITELGSELKFYRSIISPADGRSGVRIQDFEVEPTSSDNEYSYRLTLIQALDHEQPVKGTVRFEINGTEGGAAKTIHSPDDSTKGIAADFKYFQNFAGTLRLPADFAPAEIKVIFEADDDAVVQRTYPWSMRGFRQSA